jgi:hypothetical protein
MTVKELKEQLNKFDDRLTVMIPDFNSVINNTPLKHLYQGVNEADGCLFLDAYEEND